VRRVIRCRFKNFVRRLRRRSHREQACCFLTDSSDENGEETAEISLAATAGTWSTAEPLKRLVAREDNQRLAAVLAELDGPLQELWHVLTLGLQLGAAAQYLGISYEQAKDRRQRLLATLRQRLGAID
jgi:DNA-directed RNA polymerase specialized sigma24 family protein